MNLNEDKLLVVSPCTKRMGIAVFDRTELVYFAVITLKPPRTLQNIKEQVSKTIRTLIEESSPSLLVIKALSKYQVKSDKLHLVAKSVRREAENESIPLQEISFESAKRELCLSKKATRANAFKSLSEIYPELQQFVNHPSKWQADYYKSLLSAVAIGFYCRNKAAR